VVKSLPSSFARAFQESREEMNHNTHSFFGRC
jgi:hypothetical protein